MLYSVLAWPIILPVLFWAFYHYYKDERQPEPLGHLLLAFLLGVGAYYLAGFLYQSLDLLGLRFDAFELARTSPAGLLVYAILAIGVIEEIAKMIPFLLVVIHFKEFDEPLDGMIYGSFIALGFAAFENVQYVQSLDAVDAMARGFAGPVVHIVFASIWAYFIGREHLCGRPVLWPTLAALGVTAVLHGLYDFLVLTMHPLSLPPAALLIGGIWLWRLRLINDLHAMPPGTCPTAEDTPAGQ